MKSNQLAGISVAACLAISAMAYAQSHLSHSWVKQSETADQDVSGDRVVICIWKCVADLNNPHMTQTQGLGFCPMPPTLTADNESAYSFLLPEN